MLNAPRSDPGRCKLCELGVLKTVCSQKGDFPRVLPGFVGSSNRASPRDTVTLPLCRASPRQEMSNQTTRSEFLLLGFSDVRELQIFHFTVLLVIYLAALMGNLLIVTIITLDRHLHTPMYFFLDNLSILDLRYISVTVPKSMASSLTNTRRISFSGCVCHPSLFGCVLCCYRDGLPHGDGI
ncbi:unnamed protein product [Natator depressus]